MQDLVDNAAQRGPQNPFDLSLSCMLVITFMHSTSPAYLAAVQMAAGATFYGIVGTGRSTMHIVGFDAAREEAARALALLTLIAEWKNVQVWCCGKQLISSWTVRKVLDCYLASASCTDWRAHCVTTIDIEQQRPKPGMGGGIFVRVLDHDAPSPPPPARDYRAFPCRLAAPMFRFDPHHPSSYADQAQASVVAQACDWCPRFDASLSGRASGG